MFLFRNFTTAAATACSLGAFSLVSDGVATPAFALSHQTLELALAAATELQPDVRAVYEAREHRPIWIGEDNQTRARALLAAVRSASDHGLPAGRYEADALEAALNAAQGPEAAAAELLATRIYLSYAQDLISGALEPSAINREIAVKPPRRPEGALLEAVANSTPRAFFKALAPRHPDYTRLLAEKKRLEAEVANDATPQLGSRTMRQGSKGPNVVALRTRLGQLGYGGPADPAAAGQELSEVFDADLRATVRQFQKDRGLVADGIVGPGTLRAFGGTARDKLQKVIVGLERERWLNRDRGQRHIIVNIADFSFNLYEDGKVAFHSITVVGRGTSDRRTPEFHDEMTHMVVNPTWHVPSSIAGKEYLPTLKRNGGLRGLKVINRSGRVVQPGTVDFTKYSAKNFPFSIKQPPGPRNALGRVKFMFPNRYNIYLHDTPSKNLFKREVRAFSHGCIRVQRPFDFAYALLKPQSADPQAAFDSWLKTGREQYVNLVTPVPVYLTYKTAFVEDGKVSYRPDVYGRDKGLWKALVDAGLETPGADS